MDDINLLKRYLKAPIGRNSSPFIPFRPNPILIKELNELGTFFYENNLTFYRLAKLLKVSPSALTSWFKGGIPEKRLHELRNLKVMVNDLQSEPIVTRYADETD